MAASASASPSRSPSASPSASFSRSPSASTSGSPSVSPSASPSAAPATVVTAVSVSHVRGVNLVKWVSLKLTGDSGKPVCYPNFADKSVQVIGDFQGGTTLLIQGSNTPDDPRTFSTLNDSFGNPLVFTGAGLKSINENALWIRPILSVAGTNPNVSVYLLVETTARG